MNGISQLFQTKIRTKKRTMVLLVSWSLNKSTWPGKRQCSSKIERCLGHVLEKFEKETKAAERHDMGRRTWWALDNLIAYEKERILS